MWIGKFGLLCSDLTPDKEEENGQMDIYVIILESALGVKHFPLLHLLILLRMLLLRLLLLTRAFTMSTLRTDMLKLYQYDVSSSSRCLLEIGFSLSSSKRLSECVSRLT